MITGSLSLPFPLFRPANFSRAFTFASSPLSESLELARYYRQGRQLLLTFFTMVTRWSRSTSSFYALIGQNLTGEFMRKIYAASRNLFNLTAEADRILCQLVMF